MLTAWALLSVIPDTGIWYAFAMFNQLQLLFRKNFTVEAKEAQEIGSSSCASDRVTAP